MVGKNIKKLRKEHNLTQKELADRLNISDSTISSWERGRTEPNMGDIENLSQTFGVMKSAIVGEVSVEFLDDATTTQKLLIEISHMSEQEKEHLLQYINFMMKEN